MATELVFGTYSELSARDKRASPNLRRHSCPVSPHPIYNPASSLADLGEPRRRGVVTRSDRTKISLLYAAPHMAVVVRSTTPKSFDLAIGRNLRELSTLTVVRRLDCWTAQALHSSRSTPPQGFGPRSGKLWSLPASTAAARPPFI